LVYSLPHSQHISPTHTILFVIRRPDRSTLFPYTTLFRSDNLTALGTLLEAVNSTYKLPNRKLPMSALERALNAAMTLADNMHVIGKQATASPRDALAALDSSRSIEPENPVWDMVAHMLDSLYETLEAYQIYVPAADGSDLELWLNTAQSELEPYTERLFDEMLVSIV